jgi:hypothetical protein
VNRYARKIPDLGTKTVRKFIEFNSIHVKCNLCSRIFLVKRKNIIPNLSVSEDVLDTVLTLYYDFGHSGKMIELMMEKLYSVKLKSATILKWIRKYGEEFCKKNELEYQDPQKEFSGVVAIDGTFPNMKFIDDSDDDLTNGKKKVVPYLLLTQLPDGTLVAIWEEEKTKKK